MAAAVAVVLMLLAPRSQEERMKPPSGWRISFPTALSFSFSSRSLVCVEWGRLFPEALDDSFFSFFFFSFVSVDDEQRWLGNDDSSSWSGKGHSGKTASLRRLIPFPSLTQFYSLIFFYSFTFSA
jgi:hypothetical protein